MQYGPKITIKKSVFVGAVAPVSGGAEARALVKDLKRSDRRANHVAFAFRVAGNPVSEVMSDDGEPRGTAGLPLLMLLRNREMTGALVTVTRYYGGINLGPGNLARAYVEAAKAALEKWIVGGK
jgi:putative IMPACT (imprinted ancient) family translation regulator